ncbi:MAG: hypothetical protein AAFS12_08830 [Cyanobacteria bacterium J06632_19]
MNSNTDIKHLKLLSIFHYVVGGILIFFSLAQLISGIVFLHSIEPSTIESSGELFSPDFKYYVAVMSVVAFILGKAIAIATILSGRFLKLHKRYWFSFVTACFLCLFTPYGTILGVFTLIVLCRQSVKELYSVNRK